jgi:hypothetical protein
MEKHTCTYCNKEHVPNEETKKAFEDTDKGIGLTEYKNVEQLFEEIGL